MQNNKTWMSFDQNRGLHQATEFVGRILQACSIFITLEEELMLHEIMRLVVKTMTFKSLE